MAEANAAAVTMLGMPGFRVLAVQETDGEIETTVETDPGPVGCPVCGVRARAHARRDVVVRDVEVCGRRGRLRWRKRVWRCHEPACPKATWTEQRDAIPARAMLTTRAAWQACVRVGRDNVAVAKVARDYGVGWHTVMRAVRTHGQPLIDDPHRLDGVTRLGMDETAFLRASRLRHTSYVSGLVDTATGRLLDVVQDRTAKAVTDWLAVRDPQWLTAIGIVALDPHRGYANAVGVHLGHATLVVDRWHAIRLGNAMVDDVRRRVQQETTGHRGRTTDPLYRIRRTLLMAADRLTDRQWTRLETAWDAADPNAEVYNAWAVKELLRDIYSADDLHAAREALEAFYDWTGRIGIRECTRLAGTVRRWETEILAFHLTGGASNGPTEAVNLLIKKVLRMGHGFRRFDNYRLRLLLHCGVTWHDAPAARIRGRRPRLAA